MASRGSINNSGGVQPRRLSSAAATPRGHPAAVELPSVASMPAAAAADGAGGAPPPPAATTTTATTKRRASRGENQRDVLERGSRAVRFADIEKWFLAFWFSPDGHSFAAGAKEIFLYDMETGTKTLASRRTSLVYACSCSPDGVLFVVGDEEGHLIVYYLGPPVRKEGEEPPKLWEKKLDSSVTDAVFSPDGKWIATVTRTGEAALHDAIDGKQPGRPFVRRAPDAPNGAPFRANGCHEHMSTVSFSDRIIAVAGGRDNKGESRMDSMRVGLWSYPDMVELQCVDLGINAVTPVVSVAIRPDGAQLAVGTGSGTIRSYPLEPDPEDWERPYGEPPQAHVNSPIFWRNDLPPGAAATEPHAVAALTYSNTPGCATAHIDDPPDPTIPLCSFCQRRHRPRWMLAAGLETGKFKVYDIETTAGVADFEIPRSAGTVCAFGSDDSILGIGAPPPPPHPHTHTPHTLSSSIYLRCTAHSCCPCCRTQAVAPRRKQSSMSYAQ
jgi:WD40 repeat protein